MRQAPSQARGQKEDEMTFRQNHPSYDPQFGNPDVQVKLARTQQLDRAQKALNAAERRLEAWPKNADAAAAVEARRAEVQAAKEHLADPI